MTIVGVILSGGAGRRMGGVRKAGLRLGGVTLLARLRERLTPQCARLLHSVASDSSATPLPGLTVLSDDPHWPGGPAGGLHAALGWCRTHAPDALILTAAVDSPFFPADFGDRAYAMLGPEAGCVVAAHDSDRYPTNALWRPDSLDAALKGTPDRARGPSLFALAEAAGCVALDYSRDTRENPFANINTLADMLRLSKRL